MNNARSKTTIVIHPATKIYLDYGSELSRESGVVVAFNGYPPGDFRFEGGKTTTDVFALWADAPVESFEVSVGEHITRRVDMNPHGLM